MIPKIIHYCWFGGNPLPDDAKTYIEGWKKLLPDWDIMEWNESNFDISKNAYAKEAYEAKKYAFISDYARMKALEKYGGVYLDTDVELVRPFTPLLDYGLFVGTEAKNAIATCTIGAEKGCKWISDVCDMYENRHFIKENGELDLTTNVILVSRYTKETYGIPLDNKIHEFGDGYVIFPPEYFVAKNYKSGYITKTENTYTIHHFAGSWLPEKDKASTARSRKKYALIKEHGPLLGRICWRIERTKQKLFSQ